MEFEIYCDESGLEALSNKEAHAYSAIGGIWITSEHRQELKDKFNAIRAHYGVKGELKWSKISPKFFNLYLDVIDLFFSSEFIRFRVITMESCKVDHLKFNDHDAELGFYKFYYQLLNHWIFDFNTYEIFLDLKVNRDKGRLISLKNALVCANLTADIRQVQGLPSEQSIGIQIADILTGMVNAKFNRKIESTAKLDLIKHVESQYLHKPIAPTGKWDEKFNIFRINLDGGW